MIIVLASVDMAMLLLEPFFVFMGGDIISHISFFGLVDFSALV